MILNGRILLDHSSHHQAPLVLGDDHLVRAGIPHGLGVPLLAARVMILSFGFIALAVTVM